MMILVVGGSGSGKSSYAEEIAVSLARENVNEITMKKYYLATMQIFDEEGRDRVERHRNLRKGKGFFTIEQPIGISCVLKKMETGDRTVLLECISNLTANEMFSGEKAKTKTQVMEDIIRDIEMLKKQTTHFVVVSNNVFEDGIIYDQTTTEYIHAMGIINYKLAALADRVVEVVAGIPVIIKQ
ncbi:MAG: cobinamide kinase [Lachnospiraceae bacterium]|nr:cobinamide kinase [Lachnospiraceae bacterium]